MDFKISIILPSLNVVDYISECIESVLTQTLSEIEIICVDAASSDGTYETLEKYAKQDSRIKLLHSEKKSYGKQVNMGLSIAEGKYIAIVETDDFVSNKMYEYLYHLAEANDADYAKANYDSFITLKSGSRLYTQHNLFYKKDELYENMLKPSDKLEIFKYDTAIWKGIYNRSFLQKNNIVFNETSGAAFQDIGFMLHVLCKAQRAVYTKESYYRYRMDREVSSSNNLNGLKYAYQEFKRLYSIELLGRNTKEKNLQGIYGRMGVAFLDEIDKLLKYYDNLEGTWVKEIEKYYEWFCDELKGAMAQGVLTQNCYTENEWFKLRLLLHSFSGYADYMYVQNQISTESEIDFLQGIAHKKIIIFGSGLLGKRAYERLCRKNIEIVAFCDNNSSIWGNRIGDIEVKSPMECIKGYGNACYLIACKEGNIAILNQLLDSGIEKENIQIFC